MGGGILLIINYLLSKTPLNYDGVFGWGTVFELGMCWAMYAPMVEQYLSKWREKEQIDRVVFDKRLRAILSIIAVLGIGFGVTERLLEVIPHFNGTFIDQVYTPFVALLVLCLHPFQKLNSAWAWLGKHATNIYLTHTFVYYYYWRKLIFWTHNPILMFATLLLITLAISIALEFIKKKICSLKFFHI